MADEIEQIEARLAAYIDGTLPPEQTAEIEAYLSANPTHGKLIEELKSIRAAVRSLPRETVPAEVLDTLQSQLERQSLLAPVHDPIPLNAHRRPQLGAVAAVLLLAGGLGLLIYQVMPGTRRGDSDLAILTESATRPDEKNADVRLDEGTPVVAAPTLRTKDVTATARQDADLLASNRGQSMPDLAQAGVQQQQAVTMGLRPEAIDQTKPAMLQTEAGTVALPERPATAPAATRAIIVRSDDPVLTRNLLAATLTRDRIAFEVPSAVPLTLSATLPAEPALPGAASSGARRLGTAAVEGVVGRLRLSGELTDAQADAALADRNVVLRGVTRAAAVDLAETVNRQRPGRQQAGLAGELGAAAVNVNASQPATRATRPAVAIRTPSDFAGMADAGPPTTTAPAGDFVVLIVPAVPSTPATTQAATVPATRPTPEGQVPSPGNPGEG